MDWVSVLVNLGSGSIGVVVTLALTGWWNWRDRRETRTAIELQEINNYLDRTNELTRILSLDVEFVDKATAATLDIDTTAEAHSFLRFFHQTEQSYVRLASSVKDEYVLKQAHECINAVGQFQALISRNEGTEQEQVERINTFVAMVTRTYATCNRNISKHIVAKHGPAWA